MLLNTVGISRLQAREDVKRVPPSPEPSPIAEEPAMPVRKPAPGPERPPAPDYDGHYKLMFGDPVMVRDLLRAFAPPDIAATLDFSTLKPLPTELIDERTGKKRRSDSIWEVRTKEGSPCYVAVLLEFQSRSDQDMAVRVLVYSALFLQSLARANPKVRTEGYPPLLPFVIHTGPGDWEAKEEVAELFMPMSKEHQTGTGYI